MKTIVCPGELISDKAEKGQGILVRDNKTYSKYLGVLYKTDYGLQVIPLQGKYAPKIDDDIIGVIVDEDVNGYIVDVRSSKNSYVLKRFVNARLHLGNVLLLKVLTVNELKEIQVEVKGKLDDGILLEIAAKKVPRVIGKNKSMLDVLEKHSKSEIFVGSNGFILVKNGVPNIVKKAINIIDKYSHVDNLTDKIDAYLSNGED